jgi:hypothetical protein
MTDMTILIVSVENECISTFVEGPAGCVIANHTSIGTFFLIEFWL